MAEQSDRTEAPTARRREEARRHGQVILSPEIAPVAVLLAATTIASWGVPRLLQRSALVFHAWLVNLGPIAAHDDDAGPVIGRALLQIGEVLAPFLLVMALVAAGAIVAQIGFAMTPELLMPKGSRLNPVNGLKRIFSSQGAVNLLKSVGKIAVLGTVAWSVVGGVLPTFVTATGMALPEILKLAGESLRHLVMLLAVALAVIAAADYAWTRVRHERSLRMSRHEVKDEQKQAEGDPAIKARFRRAARELGKRRMLADVARADVVLANPIHFAVAIRYRATEGGAPRVLAKGAGDMAQKIKEAARQAGVPIVERRALARALYRAVEIGQEIPPALYRAVAEILAYIYSLRRSMPLGVR